MSQNYFTIYQSKNFKDFKYELIDLIYKDTHGRQENNIFKTDYFVKSRGEWYNFFKEKVLNEFSIWFLQKYKANAFICDKCWYQIYEKNNFHETHTHAGTNFTNVFFLQLPNQNLKTNFHNKSYSADEGDLISFPAFVPHNSKINIYDKHKIIISFNSSLEIN